MRKIGLNRFLQRANLTGLSRRRNQFNYSCNAHANPPAPRTRGANPKAHAFGRAALSVLLDIIASLLAAPLPPAAATPLRLHRRTFDGSE